MPFFEDHIVDDEVMRSPIWGTFALVKDNIEALVVINLLWSVTLLPVLAAIACSTWPLWLRLALFFVSLTLMGAATGVLFGLADIVCRQEPLSLEVVKRTVRTLAFKGFQRLAPLYGIFGLGLIIVVLASLTHLLFIQTLVLFVLLWLLFSSLYWGPAFAVAPDRAPWLVVRDAFKLAWRYPVPTLRTGLVVLALAILGVVSLVGIILIVPALVAILQTYRYRELSHRIQLKKQVLAFPS